MVPTGSLQTFDIGSTYAFLGPLSDSDLGRGGGDTTVLEAFWCLWRAVQWRWHRPPNMYIHIYLCSSMQTGVPTHSWSELHSWAYVMFFLVSQTRCLGGMQCWVRYFQSLHFTGQEREAQDSWVTHPGVHHRGNPHCVPLAPRGPALPSFFLGRGVPCTNHLWHVRPYARWFKHVISFSSLINKTC